MALKQMDLNPMDLKPIAVLSETRVRKNRQRFVESFNVGRDMVVHSMLCKRRKMEQDEEDSFNFLSCKTGNAGCRLGELWSILESLDAGIKDDLKNCQLPLNHFVCNMPELFLCETMHQITLCISDHMERKTFVASFRTSFQKQCIISAHIIGPIIRDVVTSCKSEDARKVVDSFCTYGYIIPSVTVPLDMRLAVVVSCDDVVGKHFPELIGRDSFTSTVYEIMECMQFLKDVCQLYRERPACKSSVKDTVEEGVGTGPTVSTTPDQAIVATPQDPHTLSLYFRRKAVHA